MANRQLDVTVARLRGHKILGEAPSVPGYGSGDAWQVSYDGQGEMQPVYLGQCFCDYSLYGEFEALGHRPSCLNVVSFYHQDAALAIQALEQVCDERELTPLLRYEHSCWYVELWDQHGRVARGEDETSLPLAICKALADNLAARLRELEEQINGN